MGKQFRRLQDRRGARGTVVGVHTMVSSMGSYIVELHKFVVEAASPELQDKLEPVIAEMRNFEEAFVTYLKFGGR